MASQPVILNEVYTKGCTPKSDAAPKEEERAALIQAAELKASLQQRSLVMIPSADCTTSQDPLADGCRACGTGHHLSGEHHISLADCPSPRAGGDGQEGAGIRGLVRSAPAALGHRG